MTPNEDADSGYSSIEDERNHTREVVVPAIELNHAIKAIVKLYGDDEG